MLFLCVGELLNLTIVINNLSLNYEGTGSPGTFHLEYRNGKHLNTNNNLHSCGPVRHGDLVQLSFFFMLIPQTRETGGSLGC